MAEVVVVSTGGTIASRTDDDGVTRAQDPVDAVLARVPVPPGVGVRGVEADRRGSFALSLADMGRLAARVREVLDDDGVSGVVVTHGTDTLEAGAYLAHLVLDDPRPVVFTGAMRAADVPDGDGPRNVADAIAVAVCPRARDLGVLVAFDGQVLPAAGTQKVHTTNPAAFAHPDAGPLGHVGDGVVGPLRAPSAAERRRLGTAGVAVADLERDLGEVRVDVVASYPGADGSLLRAAVAAGARGVVLEATGAGNATPALCEAVAEAVRGGIAVAVSTRVHAGPVTPVYGGGGGADLVASGAVPVERLRAPQALVLLTCLLAATSDHRRVLDVLGRW